jgi:hypothetical protein
MTYSDKYRCSGCSLTFDNPSAWRHAGAPRTPAGTSNHETEGMGRTDSDGSVYQRLL